MKNIFKLFPYIKGFYGRIVGLMLFSLIIAGLNALQPQVFKLIVDTLSAKSTNLTWSDVLPYVVMLVAITLGTITAKFFFGLVALRAHLGARSSLRVRTFEKLTSLDVSYFDTNRPGAIMQKTGDAIGSFTGWIASLNYSLLAPIFTIITITIVLALNNIILGLLSVAIVVFNTYEYLHVIKRNKEQNRIWRKHNERASAVFSETIQNMSTIASLSSFKRFQRDMQKEVLGAQEMGTKVRTRWQWSNVRLSSFNEMMYILALLFVLYQLIRGRSSVGEFVALTAYFSTIQNQAGNFANFIPDTETTERDAERLVQVLETEPTFPDAEGAVPLKKLTSLEFRNVSFTYPDGKKGAVENISFKIDGKHSVALVGPSGVGKSTITKLMLRFYAPTSGEILINGEPADHFTHESVRAHIGMVMQDVALFNTSVKENLRLAREKASMADLISAAEQAHAAEFIEELPKQYNTIVGERGVKLSGGQKQRIAIARAILKDPDLIILDEATSALDSESERLVQAGLKQLMKGRLGLTIAHRLSTVRHADEILVLKKGTIAERGTHEELMAKPRGLYHKLFKLQSATGQVKL